MAEENNSKPLSDDIIGNLERIAANVPVLKLDRNISTICNSILNDAAQMAKLKDFLLGCTTFAIDYGCGSSPSTLKSVLRFARNMLALDKLYDTVKTNITVNKSDNYSVWNQCFGYIQNKYAHIICLAILSRFLNVPSKSIVWNFGAICKKPSMSMIA